MTFLIDFYVSINQLLSYVSINHVLQLFKKACLFCAPLFYSRKHRKYAFYVSTFFVFTIIIYISISKVNSYMNIKYQIYQFDIWYLYVYFKNNNRIDISNLFPLLWKLVFWFRQSVNYCVGRWVSNIHIIGFSEYISDVPSHINLSNITHSCLLFGKKYKIL